MEAPSDGEAAEGLRLEEEEGRRGSRSTAGIPLQPRRAHLEQIPICRPEDIIEPLILDELHLFKYLEATLSLMNN